MKKYVINQEKLVNFLQSEENICMNYASDNAQDCNYEYALEMYHFASTYKYIRELITDPEGNEMYGDFMEEVKE